MEKNKVKHPSHYAEGRKYEPVDVIRDWELNFNLGNAVKYISRAGRKEDAVLDLEKAIQYIQFEIDAIKAENTPHSEDKLDAMRYAVDVSGGTLEVPEGMSPMEIFEEALRKMYGGESE